MSKRPDPAWYGECRRLRADGQGFLEIAEALGKSGTTVRHLLNENGEQQRKRDWENENRRKARSDEKASIKRTVRPILVDPETKRKAVEAFAAGRIDRRELIKRISVPA